MSINFACDQCGKSFTVDDNLAGKAGRCKQCGATLTIPNPSIAPDAGRPGDAYSFEGGPPPPRAGAVSDLHDPFAPPSRSKTKKRGVLGVIGTVFKAIIVGFGALFGLGVVVGVLGVAFPGIRAFTTPGLKTKAQMEAIIQKRVALNEELATILGNVRDVDGAKAASPKATGKIREITLNLREMKTAKALQTDLDALKVDYTAPQMAAAQRVLGQVMRVAQIPDAWDALAVQPAFEELEREEKSIPGLKQAELPATPDPATPPFDDVPPVPEKDADPR